ncbi:RNA polymerase sigma factor [Alkalibaculum bacchi]|uniref:RNA polymerase sigma factor n=1 Tax=Alkalibaculum bacchi TaxID=645887 RepID=UPI0026F0E38A|nr:RNA polymerase sigma factor [Alkalibaculum bacchi]
MDADFLLVKKMKIGDEQAVDIFIHKYYPQILKYCRLHIHDYNHAEDMTQETFERFFRTLNQYQHYGKAANYLYVIAANRCRDYYRKKSEIAVERLPEQLDWGMEDIEEWLDVQSALDSLPHELREVAVLFFFQGVKQKEIARILGIGLPLIKYRCRKAKEKLVKYLEKEKRL